ncbi:hypothetical protein FRC98_16950 [Lujinxingia vulgaris]|uniref:BIG2 domain-containing protein n=1 Tax=Lujinxingia vulgaris TaxID=2600176 RepID=A0A5C6X7S7_9DELT|nr:hypothetical protein [Lujinxingia vulgaris]TXD35159.1 hypothetical protein FRC98_16950 [Lujinxingia vulgaris]
MSASKFIYVSGAVLAGGLLWGCGEPASPEQPLIIVEDEDSVWVEEMLVEPATQTLAVGEERALDIAFFDASGTRLNPATLLDDVELTSSDSEVVAIGEDGQLRGVAEGSAQVTVRYEALEQLVEVEVQFERWRKVSASVDLTCALDWQGAVYCWGHNTGAIIEPTNQQVRPIPEPVRREGLPDVIDIAVGGGHACAVTRPGEVYCWGLNYDGVTGVEGAEVVFEPTPVRELDDIIRVDAGPYHTCALSRAGALYCWGYSARGAVGEGLGVSTALPVQVGIDDPIAEVAVGINNTCAVTTDGKVYCWGLNTFGLVNPESNQEVIARPSRLVLPGRATSVGVGVTAACAVLENGELYCWGYNPSGVTGERAGNGVQPPTRSTSVPALRTVHLHTQSACGITTGDELYCWGDNRRGQLGHGTKSWDAEPDKVAGDLRWMQVELGGLTTCGLDSDGELWCWGQNAFAQVGDGRQVRGNSFRPVEGEARFSRLVSGYGSNCGQLRGEDRWHCWGRNAEGQLDRLQAGDLALPTSIATGATTYDLLVLGRWTACNITFEGEQSVTRCQGSNQHQGLGSDSSNQASHALAWADLRELNFQTLALNQFHACGVAASGEMYCWGTNYNGEVGMDPRMSAAEPRRVEARTDYVSVAVGPHHSCGLTEAGEIRCWGSNAYGQLGRAASQNWKAPETIASEEVYVEVEAGQYNTCARTDEGEVHCWGTRELFGGPRGSTTVTEPIELGGPWDEIALYDQTLCALRDGEVSCAGWNVDGLIVAGGSQIVGALRSLDTGFEVSAVSMGFEHLCVLDMEGQAHCKGSNYNGELGDGAMVEHLEPYPAHREL